MPSKYTWQMHLTFNKAFTVPTPAPGDTVPMITSITPSLDVSDPEFDDPGSLWRLSCMINGKWKPFIEIDHRVTLTPGFRLRPGTYRVEESLWNNPRHSSIYLRGYNAPQKSVDPLPQWADTYPAADRCWDFNGVLDEAKKFTIENDLYFVTYVSGHLCELIKGTWTPVLTRTRYGGFASEVPPLSPATALRLEPGTYALCDINDSTQRWYPIPYGLVGGFIGTP